MKTNSLSITFFTSALLFSIGVLSNDAQARTSTLSCSAKGEVRNGNGAVEFVIVKTWDGANLTFDASFKAKGTVEDLDGEIAASTRIKADPRVTRPNLVHYEVTNDAGDLISNRPLEAFVKSSDSLKVPGDLVVSKLKTDHSTFKGIVLKGVRTNDRMHTAIYLTDGGNRSIHLVTTDLRCSYVVKD